MSLTLQIKKDFTKMSGKIINLRISPIALEDA